MSLKRVPFALAAISLVSTAIANESPTSQEPSKISSITEAAAKAHFEPFTGKIRRKNVRVRLKPDLESSVVRELERDDLVLVDGEKEQFYAVVPPKGCKGYVFRSFVLDNVIEGNRVNIRLHPSLDAPIIGQLNAGDRVHGGVCHEAPKWMEIDLPSTTRFYVAKDLVSSIGNTQLFSTLEKKRGEVDHLLSEACLLSQSELRKTFEEIDFDGVLKAFGKISDDYSDFHNQAKKSQEMAALFQDAYLQKKLAFLESRAEQTSQAFAAKQAAFDAEVNAYQMKLNEIDKKLYYGTTAMLEQIEEEMAHETAGDHELPPAFHFASMTDKMRIWEPLEECLYLGWLQDHDGQTMDEFYQEEELKAVVLAGFIEPFTRPVKNRPGDYILRNGNAPVAYLYSTRINLQDKVGQQVKIVAVSRPNNHFAFPAYYVLSTE